MFVTILSIGIANILATLASNIDYHTNQENKGICISWIILLLLAHFNMFWHTIAIMSIETWRFAGFLYTVTGPILILFASDLMLPGRSQGEFHDLKAHYFLVSRRFFFIIALLKIWDIGVDVVLGRGFTGAGGLSLVMLGLAVTMATSQAAKLHFAGTIAAWILFVTGLALRGWGVIV
jgi:hypothetical protein